MLSSSSELVETRIFSGSLQPNAYSITNSIDDTTTIEEFKEILGQYPRYKLEYGGRCGWNIFGICAMKGSLELLQYLISLRPDLVNLGNEFGWTPLLCLCARSDDKEDLIYAKAKFLLENGANPNYGSTSKCGDSVYGDTSKNTKPIDFAKKRSLQKVVELLLSQTTNKYDNI